VTTPVKISTKKQARELTAAIRHGLMSAEKALKEFIAGAGWEVLEYDSFESWYDDNLADITLAVELRTYVIYHLLETNTVEQVAEKTKGVGPRAVTSVANQKANGVPADKATIQGGQRRGGGRKPSHIRIDTGSELYAQVAEVAGFYGQSVEEAALDFIREGVDRWLPQARQAS
jgi:hypothetical protein